MSARTPRLFAALLAAALALPAAAADTGKTLRVAFQVAESGFDPQAVSDAYSFDICRAIFDPLYTYDYFARPVRMVPNTADGMPQITDGGQRQRRGEQHGGDAPKAREACGAGNAHAHRSPNAPSISRRKRTASPVSSMSTSSQRTCWRAPTARLNRAPCARPSGSPPSRSESAAGISLP